MKSHALKTAVILGAGSGRRLKNVVTDYPKGFLKLGQKPIVQESIEKLLAFNVEEIIIVTGFASRYYEELVTGNKKIKIIKNEVYADSGSMYSLACARNLIKRDFLLLESDLIYEKAALEALQSSAYSNSILLSGTTNSGDEVYVDVKDHRIFHISKKREEVKSLGGELVGISKISLSFYQEMLKEADQFFKTNLNWEYDTGCISNVAKRTEIFATKVNDLVWSEVDNEEHLNRAKQTIYPKIMERDLLFQR
jgi:choline kinase